MGGPTAYQAGLAAAAMSLGPTHMVTLTVNDPTWRRPGQAFALMRRDLRHWLAQLDRRLLGKHYARQPMDRRVDGLFVAELLTSNPHLHGVLRLPEDRLDTDLQGVGEALWRGIVPAGEFRARAASNAGAGGYVAKTQTPNSEIIFARDFHPAS